MSALSTSRSHENDVLMVRSGKWTLTIVTLLREERMRFNELKRIAGISQKTLTLTLRELERDGFVTRTMFATIPPRVDYELTDLGRSLQKPITALAAWALDNVETIHAAQDRYDREQAEREAA